MPTSLKDGAQVLTKPQTRVAQMWRHVWHAALVDNKRRTKRARAAADQMRHIK